MTYVYILESVNVAGERYIGQTDNLRTRLADHNRGHSPHSAKYGPWKLVFYAAFDEAAKARAFERYLKTGSGRTFARRHF